MAKITVIFGIVLIALGIVGYAGSGAAPPAASSDADPDAAAADSPSQDAPAAKSITALIPAFVGGALLVCGLLALKESLLKHAMHGAAMIGLLGALAGAGRGAMGLGKFFSDDPSLNQRSFLFVWLMAAICGVFVALCVRSFIQVRKQRQLDEAT